MMPAVRTAEIIPVSSKQMFELVNDIEAYPEFLPWCSDARIERQFRNGIVATVSVAKGPMHQSFTTENHNREFDRIEMGLLKGPFKHFRGVWRFDDVSDGCRVSFDLDFEFSNRLLAIALSKIFETITESMIKAFRRRARDIHGS